MEVSLTCGSGREEGEAFHSGLLAPIEVIPKPVGLEWRKWSRFILAFWCK